MVILDTGITIIRPLDLVIVSLVVYYKGLLDLLELHYIGCYKGLLLIRRDHNRLQFQLLCGYPGLFIFLECVQGGYIE